MTREHATTPSVELRVVLGQDLGHQLARWDGHTLLEIDQDASVEDIATIVADTAAVLRGQAPRHARPVRHLRLVPPAS